MTAINWLKKLLPPARQVEQIALPQTSDLSPPATPSRLYFPVISERLQAREVKVAIGQQVSCGQLLAIDPDQQLPIHASASGQITQIFEHPIIHPQGVKSLTIELSTTSHTSHPPDQQFNKQQSNKQPSTNHPTNFATLQQLPITPTLQQQWLQTITNAGIIGMGGAGFSTSSKLKLSLQQSVHSLIINACECEPFISCDDTLMQHWTVDFLQGVALTAKLLQVENITIIIEANKPDSIAAIKKHLPSFNLQLHIVHSNYPTGHERQLVELISSKKLSAKEAPISQGYVVLNVATCYAIGQTLTNQLPITERIITLSDGKQIINTRALIGTPIEELFQRYLIDIKPPQDKQSIPDPAKQIIVGGPMNGIPLPFDARQAGILKTTNSLLYLPLSDNPLDSISSKHDSQKSENKESEESEKSKESEKNRNNKENETVEETDWNNHLPCIRCGDCVSVCPTDLLPQQLYWYAQAEDNQQAMQYRLFDCIECGNCAFVCPSHIPLVQYFRRQKKQIQQQQQQQQQTDLAKDRFEQRNQRLAKQRQEHQQKLQQRRQQAQEKLKQRKPTTQPTKPTNQTDQLTNHTK